MTTDTSVFERAASQLLANVVGSGKVTGVFFRPSERPLDAARMDLALEALEQFVGDVIRLLCEIHPVDVDHGPLIASTLARLGAEGMFPASAAA